MPILTLDRRAFIVVPAVVAVWFVFAQHVAPVDLLVFLHAAHAVAHGFSPYLSPSVPALWSGHAFVYPYLAAWWFVPLAAVPTAVAGFAFYLLSVAALATAARLLAGPGSGVVPILLATTAEPVVRGLQLGTVNAFLLLGVALAWRHRHRSWVVVLALTTVVVAKLFLVPMVAWLVLTRRLREAVGVVALSGAVIVVGCWMSNLSVSTYARMLSVLSQHEAPHSSSLTAALLSGGLDQSWATTLAWVAAALVLAAGAIWSRRRQQEGILFIACIAASIVASPIVWSHYYTLLVAVPIVLRLRPAYLLVTLVCSWLVATPTAGHALRVLDPFPGAGWVWTAIIATAVVLGVRHVTRTRERRLAAEGPQPVGVGGLIA